MIIESTGYIYPQALEKNSEDLGVFLKSLVPRREEFSTDGAYEQALFLSSLADIQIILVHGY